ncbi:MAG: MerR family transcriptional regulator [Intrasporangium sp.]|uniref:MerR family transcriptional regulator n=1 Tax=Intrasporangium sp. TaxID=1925024 RepID=UPI002648E43A|nr:MerR family transcriptional regulator [Intrasporangium sp.]MDN5794535.1 MerR family transcriptional regulator [Intrasporangium sp.]
MRVKELADLAGTTVRTVRHYHHVGLLHVPARSAGQRDYDVEHLARLLRIRWLAEAGLPLATIADVLPAAGRSPKATALEDLEATLLDIDERLTELTVQRARVAGLIERVRSGAGISPLPAPVALIYDALAERMPPRARRVLEIERGIVSVFAVRGLLPGAATRLAEALTTEDQDVLTEMFEAFASLDASQGDQRDEVVERLLPAVMALVDRHEHLLADLVEQFPTGAKGAISSALLRRLMRLGFPAMGQQQLVDEAFAEASRRPAIASALRTRTMKEELV